jgi:hypothetical protein
MVFEVSPTQGTGIASFVTMGLLTGVVSLQPNDSRGQNERRQFDEFCKVPVNRLVGVDRLAMLAYQWLARSERRKLKCSERSDVQFAKISYISKEFQRD